LKNKKDIQHKNQLIRLVFLFLNGNKYNTEINSAQMKKLVMPFMLVAIIVGVYEQSKAKPNIYIVCIAVVVFMYGMMQLSARTPSKHTHTENEADDNKRG
jgi:uncharacterized membrane protein YoaK (UPF0700 family)